MHPGSCVYVGFGGFTGDIDFPEDFLEAFKDDKVLTPEGDPIDFMADGDDLGTEAKPGERFFRQISRDFDCYGFEIASFDTVAVLDLVTLTEEAARWMPYAEKIGERYGFKCKPQVGILSEMA